MLTPIAGRSAVVTGASKGIGKGIARAFAVRGAKVLLTARNAAEVEAAAQELRAAGATAIGIVADVSSEADMMRMAQVAREKHGGIDILCCNAGIFPTAILEEITPESWDEMHDVNLKGTFLAVRACLPALKASKSPRVIVTSSITGNITGQRSFAHYGSTKAGQMGFVRTAAVELAQHGITVNAVWPGNIATEGFNTLGEEYKQSMTAKVPLGRLGTVDDVAHAVLFLASDEAAYITGQGIVIDGGQVLPE